jgi:hypothetical protein
MFHSLPRIPGEFMALQAKKQVSLSQKRQKIEEELRTKMCARAVKDDTRDGQTFGSQLVWLPSGTQNALGRQRRTLGI